MSMYTNNPKKHIAISFLIVFFVIFAYNSFRKSEESVIDQNVAKYSSPVALTSTVGVTASPENDAKNSENTPSDKEKALEEAHNYARKNMLREAILTLNSALSQYPGDTDLLTVKNGYVATYKTALFSEVDASYNDGEYPLAIKSLDRSIEFIGNDIELTTKRDLCIDAYVSQTVDMAKAAYIEYDADRVEESIGILEEALGIVPTNSTLLSELSMYKSKQPTRIETVPNHPFHGDPFERIGEVYDNQGQLHTDALHMKYYSVITIDYQYTKLTGTFFQSQKYASAPVNHPLVIYGSLDGNNWDKKSPLWSGTVSGNSNVLTIDINVREWKYLVFAYADWNSDYDQHCYMSDMYLWK